MSNTPGITPITTDVADVGQSDETGFFGDEGDGAGPGEAPKEADEGSREVDREGRDRMFNR